MQEGGRVDLFLASYTVPQTPIGTRIIFTLLTLQEKRGHYILDVSHMDQFLTASQLVANKSEKKSVT